MSAGSINRLRKSSSLAFEKSGSHEFLETSSRGAENLDHTPSRFLSFQQSDHDRGEPFSASVRVTIRNDSSYESGYQDTDGFSKQIGKHEHLLKSGPLGRCNDPYCTTCPSYFNYPVPSRTWARTSILGGARNFKSIICGWSKDWFPDVINPHTKFVQRWNQFFVISCLVAIFIDPLFLMVFSVRQTYFCITFNPTFAIVVTVLRSITDFIYFLHMLLQFRLAYVVSTSKAGAGELVDNPKKIALNYLKGWFVLDFFAVIPLPQIMIWRVVKSQKYGNANFIKNMIRVTVLLQYVPRCVRFLPLMAGHSQNGFIFETAWVNFVINLFMYLLAGHVVGACWYLFGLQRVNVCLRQTCDVEKPTCMESYLDCGQGKHISEMVKNDSKRLNWIQTSNASFNCLLSNTTFFNFGIYINCVPVTMEPKVIAKYIYSLFWGFLQISTLAGNLVPSLFVWEVLFTMGVVGLGLLLFALLIGNMQNFLQSLGRRQMDMQLRRYDAELWMRRRNLPLHLRRRVRQAERLRWAATQGVDEDELLDGLPEDLHKEIRRMLALDYIRKVRIFQVMEDIVLDAICERLHQKFYIEGSVILRANYPVERMLFILRGNMISKGNDGSEIPLRGSDFCGEELLTWCLEHDGSHSIGKGSSVKRTLSSRTVTCLSNVEAFALEAADLEYVAKNFRRYMRSPLVQGAIRYVSPTWRTWAAGCIQAAWRYRRRKLVKTHSMEQHLNGRISNGYSHPR